LHDPLVMRDGQANRVVGETGLLPSFVRFHARQFD
jgi:hypothetical protein